MTLMGIKPALVDLQEEAGQPPQPTAHFTSNGRNVVAIHITNIASGLQTAEQQQQHWNIDLGCFLVTLKSPMTP